LTRYTGEPLPAGSRIAVVANDALGNFVIVTPLLQMLRERHHPSALDYFGGRRTAELQQASDLIDNSFPLLGDPVRESLAIASENAYDLVVNVESSPFAMVVAASLAGETGAVVGPCAGSAGRGTLAVAGDDRGRLQEDPDWMRPDITSAYPFLESGWIGEIFCRLAYLEGHVPPYRLPHAEPTRPVPNILIATAASGADKLWDGWMELVELLRVEGHAVGLLGAAPTAQFWKGNDVENELVTSGLVEDFRGAFPLPGVVGAIGKAKAVVTLDNGIMHLAAATTTPTVALFRAGIDRLWAPPFGSVRKLVPPDGQPVSEISVAAVREALDGVL
jgi:ADP-heptose:LPS heptosyltransferase